MSGPPTRKRPAPTDRPPRSNCTNNPDSSRSVSWFEVHLFVAPVLERVGTWPMVGTPEWCSLAADDPRKLAALFDAAQHHALRVDLAQEARAEASHAVAGAADWPKIAREQNQHNEFHRARPWSRRQRQ